jgi:hypothetical protein
MKNFDLLPLNDIQMQRVKKFAEMHQRFGGIFIDVIAVDKETHQVLIRIKDKKGKLSPEELVQKANEVFVEEVPEGLRLYYTVMEEEDSKYYLTWDHRYVIRAHKYFFVWEIISDDNMFKLEPTIAIIYLDPVVKSSATATEQARKWLKNYLITHNERL